MYSTPYLKQSYPGINRCHQLQVDTTFPQKHVAMHALSEPTIDYFTDGYMRHSASRFKAIVLLNTYSKRWIPLPEPMMTSSNGNIFRLFGHLCGEFTGHRWIPRTKERGALMFSLICSWINGWVNNREAGDLRRHRAHYVVIVMRTCD